MGGESNSLRPFSIVRMILTTAFILAVSSAHVVRGSGECFNVTITTKLYGHENAWSLGTCVSDDGRYRENNVYTEECCLDAGKYTLNCDDTYKDGWHGGFIEIQGTQYCEDFTEGHQQSQDIDIVYPVNGGWGEFGDWEECPVSCGGGEQKRVRACNSPAPAHGGDDCAADGSSSAETRNCNENLCPIHKLAVGDVMQSGQEMISENGEYVVKVQSDGNLVLYKGSEVLWASATHGKGREPYKMTMQSDNHLVLQDADSKVIWAPDVYIGKDGHQWKEGGYAVLQDDGNLVVYDGDNKAMWATETHGGQKGSTDGGVWKGKSLTSRFDNTA